MCTETGIMKAPPSEDDMGDIVYSVTSAERAE